MTPAVVRAATPGDAAALAAIYARHVTQGFVSFETEAPDAGEMARRMAASGGLYPWLVAADGDGVLGYAYAGAFRARAAYRWSVETTVYVGDAAQRRGIGRMLYAALLATLEQQGFGQAFGIIALPNLASVALHEAMGFTAAGLWRGCGYKGGQWIDVGQWQRALTAPTVPLGEPRRFDELQTPPR